MIEFILFVTLLNIIIQVCTWSCYLIIISVGLVRLAITTAISTSISTLNIGKKGLLAIIYWVFNAQNLAATILLVLSLWNWVLRWTSFFVQIGAAIFLKLFFTVTDTTNILVVGTFVSNVAIWTTSSWRLRLLAVNSVLIGFEAWISSSEHIDKLSIAAVAAGIWIHVLTSGHLNIMALAAVSINLRAYIISSTRLNLKLLFTYVLGSGIYVMNPERPDFIPVAALVMGVAAYAVSTHDRLEKATRKKSIEQLFGPVQFKSVPRATFATRLTYIIRNEVRLPKATFTTRLTSIIRNEIRLLQATFATRLKSIIPNEVRLPQWRKIHLCTVCGEEKPLSRFLAGPTRRCLHVPRICDDDVKTWIQSQLTNTTWNRISCPDSNCNEFFEYEDVKMHGSEASFARLDQFSVSHANFANAQ